MWVAPKELNVQAGVELSSFTYASTNVWPAQPAGEKNAMNNGNNSLPAFLRIPRKSIKQLASSQEKKKGTFILTDYLFSKYLS